MTWILAIAAVGCLAGAIWNAGLAFTFYTLAWETGHGNSKGVDAKLGSLAFRTAFFAVVAIGLAFASGFTTAGGLQ